MAKEAIGVQILNPVRTTPPPPPPPPVPSSWIPRTSWPFDESLTGGRALWGVWDTTRSRFVVLGFSYNESFIPSGESCAISDDNGATWETRHLPWTPGYPGNMTIARSDSLDRTVVGGRVNGSGTATITAYSDDGGENWVENDVVIVGSAPDYYPYPADCLSSIWIEEQSQFILGTGNTATSPDGITWTKRLLPYDWRVAGQIPIDMAYSPVDDRIIMTNGSRIIVSDDAGVTWTMITTPFDSHQIIFVEWCPSIPGFIAGGYRFSDGRTIMFSSDGITWSTIGDPEDNPGGGTETSFSSIFSFIDIGPQLLAGPFLLDGKYIQASVDSAENWANSPSPGGTILSFVKGDGVVLALGGYDGSFPIMSSIIPVNYVGM